MSNNSNYSDEQPAKSGTNSPSATDFDPSMASETHQRKFKRLWYYNEDLKRDRNNTNSEEVRRREQGHIIDAVSSSVGLPEYQHKEAKNIVKQTNFTDEVKGRYLSIETYCFAICVLVHNRRTRNPANKYLPQKSDEFNPSIFSRVQEEVKVGNYELTQALNEIKSQVSSDG
jgi:hypothetical protein